VVIHHVEIGFVFMGVDMAVEAGDFKKNNKEPKSLLR
jgi:hypothetical protein